MVNGPLVITKLLSLYSSRINLRASISILLSHLVSHLDLVLCSNKKPYNQVRFLKALLTFLTYAARIGALQIDANANIRTGHTIDDAVFRGDIYSDMASRAHEASRTRLWHCICPIFDGVFDYPSPTI